MSSEAKNISIPEHKITEIQNAADILEVISESVRLKKRGKDYVGLCPFHSEKTGSFTVSPEKQMFYCFGCHTGGNVFNFLMKHEGLSYPEAIRMLANRYGIEIPTHTMSPEEKKELLERENLFAINKVAMDFFHDTLISPSGEKGLAYLNQRGISQETIDTFHLGYAPDGWDHLLKFFSQKSVALSLLQKAGLIISKKSGKGYYDRFRDRIIFPIMNIHGQVIAFGGRVMNDDIKPKYLNSPETPLFNKSRSLFGLNLTRQKCREKDEVFIVEGYIDVIALYQHGIQNSVATLGTALTPQHLRLLKGYASKATLVYDSDDAGIRAAERSIPIFEKENMDTCIMQLPSGYDPDSFIFAFGADDFAKRSKNALSMISFLIASAIKKHGIERIEDKIRVISDMEKPLSSVADSLKQELYIKELANHLNIDEKKISERIKNISSAKIAKTPKQENVSRISSDNGKRATPPDVVRKISVSNQQQDKLEKKIITIMLQFPEILPEIRQRNLLEHFKNSTLKTIGKTVLKHAGKPLFEIADLLDEEKKHTALFLAMEEHLEDDFSEYSECFDKLIGQSEGLFRCGPCRHEDPLIKKIQAAEAENNQELLAELLNEQYKMAVLKNKQKMAVLGGKMRIKN